MTSYAFLLAFPLLMAAAAIWDVLTLTIPNRISIALVVAFFVAAAVSGMPARDVLAHLACGLAVLAVGFLLFNFGWFGGGDAKLLSVAALWIGGEHLLTYTTYVAYTGGALAVLILAYRRFPMPLWLLDQPWALRLHDRKTGIPYGVAIAAAALLLFPGTAWFHGQV